MPKFIIDKEKVLKKWAPIIIDALNIKDQDKINWMSEYAETHQHNDAFQFNEYKVLEPYIKEQLEKENIEEVPFLGPYYPYTVENGRTSYGINLEDLKHKDPSDDNKPLNMLPIAMKIAQQTIGIDLVSVIPMSVENEIDRELRKRATKAVERYKKLIDLIDEQEQ